ncbi:MAG: response regulator transcription factor [Thiovulaceae bacterium]|nr:response regulator transcription factor [Sulfurimonadaceae bacterium]
MNFCYANVSILYADDATTARKHYSEFLGHLFHVVYEAHDGEEALTLYEKHRPDIVLLDVEMPKMNGLEVAEKIRQKETTTRIIIATAHISEQRLLQAVELGLTRFLPKPFGRQALKEALAKAILELDHKYHLDLGDGYHWNSSKQELLHRKVPVKLTSREYALMTLLSSKTGQVLPFHTIELYLWPLDDDVEDTAPRLKALIKRIRKKLPKDCIENIYGEGYKLNYIK